MGLTPGCNHRGRAAKISAAVLVSLLAAEDVDDGAAPGDGVDAVAIFRALQGLKIRL